MIRSGLINQQVDRIKHLRRYSKVYADDIDISANNSIYFSSFPEYTAKLIIAYSNLELLKVCRKSGSWVSVGFGKVRKNFWTSRYLKYFKDLPNVTYTRNFGTRIIRSSDHITLRSVIISCKQNPNSLNLYNHQILKHKQPPLLENAFYLCVNGANSFQHFIQDLLPVLSLIQPFLKKDPRTPLILKRPDPKFTSFEAFFQLLDIKNPKIFIEDDDISVKDLYLMNFNPINAIYAHPKELYAKTHYLIQENIPKNTLQRKNLILLIRNEATRNFSNLEEICSKLTLIAESLDLNPFFINASNVSLEILVEVFGNAEYILGFHGGAMYNTVFAPPGATIVEFITTEDTDSLLHMVMSLGLNYFPYAIKSGKGDPYVSVSVEDLDSIFNSIKEFR